MFFPGMLAGPTFNYQIYLDFINGTVDTSLKGINWLRALRPLFIAFVLLALTVIIIPNFPQDWVIVSPFYLALPAWLKVLSINIFGFFFRIKYYTGWYFAQAATNLSGLSLTKDGQYDKVIAGDLRFEIEGNPRKKTELWSWSLQTWIKEVVYSSIVKYVPADLALVLTFMLSAFWHGLELPYYLGTTHLI